MFMYMLFIQGRNRSMPQFCLTMSSKSLEAWQSQSTENPIKEVKYKRNRLQKNLHANYRIGLSAQEGGHLSKCFWDDDGN